MDKKTSASGPPLPEGPGTYILILHLPLKQSIGVGRLGEFDFPAGHYLYVGSALGPGGLAARLGRHRKLAGNSNKRLHWHVDFLREQAQLLEVWYRQQPQRLEHKWANAIGRLADTIVLVPGFGSSDCNCSSHLYHVACRSDNLVVVNRSRPRLEHLRESMEVLAPDIELIFVKNQDSNQT